MRFVCTPESIPLIVKGEVVTEVDKAVLVTGVAMATDVKVTGATGNDVTGVAVGMEVVTGIKTPVGGGPDAAGVVGVAGPLDLKKAVTW